MGLSLYFAGQLILDFGFLRHDKYSFKSAADSRREAQLLVLDASQLFNCSHSFYNHKANKTGFVAHFITRKGIKKKLSFLYKATQLLDCWIKVLPATLSLKSGANRAGKINRRVCPRNPSLSASFWLAIPSQGSRVNTDDTVPAPEGIMKWLRAECPWTAAVCKRETDRVH